MKIYSNFSAAYLTKSQCILAILSPGKVNKLPSSPHHTAMKNFSTIFEAGPLNKNKVSADNRLVFSYLRRR